GPGAKKADTAAFVPTTGWNMAKVKTPVSLPAGSYWLAYLPSRNALAFKKAPISNGAPSSRYYTYPFGMLPAVYSTMPSSTTSHWSFYATLSVDGPSDTTPPSTPTGLSTSGIDQTSTTLSWNASTDNVGVTAYQLYQNGTQ